MALPQDHLAGAKASRNKEDQAEMILLM